MSSLYDGVAALRLMYDPDLRKARGKPHVDTLRAMIGNALVDAEEGHGSGAVDGVRAAAAEARKLARELAATAKRMEDAAELGDVLGDALAHRPAGAESQ
jgi:hypothetical protein